ncbi:hypothetical protein GY45DRAFT_1227236, partial [Cubamyces sp. BRFM 1775]
MKAFITELLGFRRSGHAPKEGGVLGHVKAYYGCVEAQGRGTLHCHMMIWIEGALNPKELQSRLQSTTADDDFGRRLLAYLDDAISNSVPLGVEDPTCDPDNTYNSSVHPDCHRERDLDHLVQKNQCHKHTQTCYKYCGTGPRRCRFDLDESNVIPCSSIDAESGELCLRIENGMVNNYNRTILEALRCNMDIQYIGTGEDAKAVIYYITDYITKSPLKAHVAYAALEVALKRLHGEPGEAVADADRARRLLQRTAFSILSNQELSAQQVASYLMDYEDHFTSHRFSNLYWPSFERYIDPTCPLHTLHDISSSPDDHSDTDVAEIGFEASVETADTGAESFDEVRIGTDATGRIVELGAQLADYLYRGRELDDMCLWDFVCCTRKVN